MIVSHFTKMADYLLSIGLFSGFTSGHFKSCSITGNVGALRCEPGFHDSDQFRMNSPASKRNFQLRFSFMVFTERDANGCSS